MSKSLKSTSQNNKAIKIVEYISTYFNYTTEAKSAAITHFLDQKTETVSGVISQLVKDLQNSDLYTYYSSWGKYRRKAEQELSVESPFVAISVLNKLESDLKTLISKRPKLSTKIQGHVSDLQKNIRTTVKLIFADGSLITSTEFSELFDIIYGIYDGVKSLIVKSAMIENKQDFIHSFRFITRKKAFRDSLLTDGEKGMLKGLFSLGTQLAISADSSDSHRDDYLKLVDRLVDQIKQFRVTGNLSLNEIIF